MANSDVDLLAFADLEGEVDRIFRAYLDTQLLAFADNKDDAGYWTKVVEFRRAKLHVPDWAGDDEEKLGQPLELARKMPSRQQTSDDFVAFHYWFDVRASHWASRPYDEVHRVADQLVPAQRLEWLATEAAQLKRRIEAEQPRLAPAGAPPAEGAEPPAEGAEPPGQGAEPAAAKRRRASHLTTILSEITARQGA